MRAITIVTNETVWQPMHILTYQRDASAVLSLSVMEMHELMQSMHTQMMITSIKLNLSYFGNALRRFTVM